MRARLAVAVVAVGTLGGLAGSGEAQAAKPQTVLAKQRSAAAGGAVNAWYKVRKGSRCQLVAVKGKQRSRSRKVRARHNLLQFDWTAPVRTSAGVWKLRLHCNTRGNRRISAATKLNVTGAKARGKGLIPRKTGAHHAHAKGGSAQGGRGGGAYPPFGQVMIAGADWMGGQGVDVISNGLIGCYDGCNRRTDYGIAYQCVELINKLVVSKGWSSLIWGDGADIYDNAPPEDFDKHPVGDGYIPVPGDIITFEPGEGHVAVVDSVANGVINWVEQNDSPTGRASAPIDASGKIGNYGRLVPEGYLHAKKNIPPKTETPPIQGSSPDLQGSSPPIQGSTPGGTGGAPGTQEYRIQDDFLGGTWARTDPDNGIWYSKDNKPANGKYFFDNGFGIAIDCARSAAAYTITNNGQRQTWTWWAHVTDNTWVPMAVLRDSDGNPGVNTC